jgi:hypothetical protein
MAKQYGIKNEVLFVNVLGEHIENFGEDFWEPGGNSLGTHRERPNPKKLSDPGRLAAARLPVQPTASMCG